MSDMTSNNIVTLLRDCPDSKLSWYAADEIERYRAALKLLLPTLLADVGAKGGLTVHSRERCMAIVKHALATDWQTEAGMAVVDEIEAKHGEQS